MPEWVELGDIELNLANNIAKKFYMIYVTERRLKPEDAVRILKAQRSLAISTLKDLVAESGYLDDDYFKNDLNMISFLTDANIDSFIADKIRHQLPYSIEEVTKEAYNFRKNVTKAWIDGKVSDNERAFK